MDSETLYRLLDEEMPELQWWPGEEIRSMIPGWGSSRPFFKIEDTYIILGNTASNESRVILVDNKPHSEIVEECRRALGFWVLKRHQQVLEQLIHIKTMARVLQRGDLTNE